MKRIALVLVVTTMFLAGCQKKNEHEIIGYWMNQTANTISFTDEDHCAVGNKSCIYKIYDENHLQFVSSDGYTQEYLFRIEDDKLYIKTYEMNDYKEYTKDENEQKAILENVKRMEEETERENERLAKLQEIQESINQYQRYIEDANARIQKNREDIEKWEQDSENRRRECEEAIAFGDDKEYQENQRDEFISANEEAIQGCNTRIAELEQEIRGYQDEIKKLENEMIICE